MATAIAPTFQVTHDTIAGNVSDPITAVKNDTWVTVTATITGVRHYGTGGNQRARLVLTTENGTMLGATVNADRFPRLDTLLLATDTPVQVRGIVRRITGLPTTLEVTGIAECSDCGKAINGKKWTADEHHPKCPQRDPNF